MLFCAYKTASVFAGPPVFGALAFRIVKPFLYHRLTRSLLIEVASGIHEERGRFLSSRSIMRGWKVSQETLDKALAFLVEGRVLERRDRRRFLLAPGAIGRARLLLPRVPDAELDAPATWRNKRMSILGRRRSAAYRLAMIVDKPTNIQEVKREGMVRAFKDFPPPTHDGRWHLIAFMQEVNRRFCEADFFFDNGSPSNLRDILSHLDRKRLDGVAIWRRGLYFSRKGLLRELKKRNIPVVTVLDDCEGVADVSINFNNIAAGYRAMEVLVDHGHRDILMVSLPRYVANFEQRLEGARILLQERGLRGSVRVRRMEGQGEVLARRARKIVEEVFGGGTWRPTALFCPAIKFFKDAHPWFQKYGIKIPRDLSVIGCGSPLLLTPVQEKVDLMSQDFGKIGRVAAQTLIRLIEGQSVERTVQIDMPYRKGRTVCPPPVLSRRKSA